MTICNRCHGQGAVLGNWSMEPCVECSGTGHFDLPMSKVDKDVQGCLAASLLFGVCLVVCAAWGVIEFFWAVLA